MAGYGEGPYGEGLYGIGVGYGLGEKGRVEWNLPGERFFEAGVDRGVLYPEGGPGVAWNGLVSVNEENSGGEVEPLYFDGIKYAEVLSSEDFSVTIESFSEPPQFAAANGVRMLLPGLFVTQQRRQSFGLSYRTLKGNDLQGLDLGYKLHLVYHCQVAPSSRNNPTLAGSVAPSTRSWSVTTTPPPASFFRPTSHIVLDSTMIDPYLMEEIETALYGRDESESQAARDAYLPSVSQLMSIMSNPISEFIEAAI